MQEFLERLDPPNELEFYKAVHHFALRGGVEF
jgi:hypothetical protein